MSDFSTGFTKPDTCEGIKSQECQTSYRLLSPELAAIEGKVVVLILELKTVQKDKINELKKVTMEEGKSKEKVIELKEELNDYYRVLDEVAVKHKLLNVMIVIIFRKNLQ